VEPIIPPPYPYRVLVQQILGLLLQEKGIGASTWRHWIGRVPVYNKISEKTFNSIIQHMLKEEILALDQGILWFGPKGERLFGYKYFMDICSTFISPPLFEVRYGNNLIGYVDEISFVDNTTEQSILLAGTEWEVKQIHWDKKIADVKPTKLPGKSSWLGGGPLLSTELCHAIKMLFSHDEMPESCSKRAFQKISELHSEFDWVQEDNTGMLQQKDKATWWTFAGKLTNKNIAAIIQHEFGIKAHPDNLSIRLQRALKNGEISHLRQMDLNQKAGYLASNFYKNQKAAYKFHECLPKSILIDSLKARSIFTTKIHNTLNQRLFNLVAF